MDPSQAEGRGDDGGSALTEALHASPFQPTPPPPPPPPQQVHELQTFDPKAKPFAPPGGGAQSTGSSAVYLNAAPFVPRGNPTGEHATSASKHHRDFPPPSLPLLLSDLAAGNSWTPALRQATTPASSALRVCPLSPLRQQTQPHLYLAPLLRLLNHRPPSISNSNSSSSAPRAATGQCHRPMLRRLSLGRAPHDRRCKYRSEAAAAAVALTYPCPNHPPDSNSNNSSSRVLEYREFTCSQTTTTCFSG